MTREMFHEPTGLFLRNDNSLDHGMNQGELLDGLFYGQGLHQCSMHGIRDDVLCAYVLSRLQYWSGQAQRMKKSCRAFDGCDRPGTQRVNKMCQAAYCTSGRCSKCGGDGVR